MKLTIFDRKKYLESVKKLKLRNAPDYVLAAYDEGYVSVINEYYRTKLNRTINKNNKYTLSESKEYFDLAEQSKLKFIKEALSKSDIDFIKAFFQMTNMDIVTGKKLPPNAAKLIKQGVVKDLGLKDLYKKIR